MSGATLLDGTLARRLERLSLVTRRRLTGEGQGDRRSLRKGSSREFADYRPYTAGDDPSRIDWNIYARTDVHFVRMYEEEEVLNVHLILDASRSMDWGEPNKLEYARRLAAALGYVALNASHRVYVWPLNGSTASFGPAWGRRRAGPLVTFLADLKPAQAATPPVVPFVTPDPPNLDQAIASAPGRASGLLVLISDLLSPTWETSITRLASHRADVLVLHTLAPAELRPRLGGDVRFIDRETGATVSVTLNNDALRIYGERLGEWQTRVASACQRHGVTYIPVDTEVSLESLLFETLRRRRVVR
jgi:uncharacterized protein (DUF58 family)